jgi:osmotically inducible protein OsmC
MKTLFTAHATSTGGRAGHVATDNGTLAFDLVAQNSDKKGTNPEELFACGYAACFGSALDAVAKSQKVETGTITVKSAVELNQEGSGYFLGVTLNVHLEKLSGDAANKLVEAAHQVCPYSKATRGNIDVKLQVNEQPIAKAA